MNGDSRGMVALKHNLQSRFKPCSADRNFQLHRQNGKQRSGRIQVGISELANSKLRPGNL